MHRRLAALSSWQCWPSRAATQITPVGSPGGPTTAVSSQRPTRFPGLHRPVRDDATNVEQCGQLVAATTAAAVHDKSAIKGFAARMSPQGRGRTGAPS